MLFMKRKEAGQSFETFMALQKVETVTKLCDKVKSTRCT